MKFIKYTYSVIILLISINSYAQNPVYNQCRNGLFILIPNNGTMRDSILISLPALSFIADINITIDTLIHTWVSDLSIYLRKDTAGVKLFNRTGGSGDNFIGTIFNDSAAISIGNANAPFTGQFKPHNPLSVFNGSFNASGYWSLYISDTATGDTGFLKAWCLSISYYIYMGGINTVEIPNTYRLYQNYPNPFNPVTKIKYGLPENGYVKLTVYNDLGEEIIVLQDGYKTANTYEAEFNASDLPSGVYYYKMEAKGFIDSKKMVIVK
ncbi:MAG: T9SS type A sorting domain-containing protein [Ignavibacteria bacterium]|nr:T9SS type A sorting domain-containing protein [Ignavibacteria bacterium]